MALKEDVLGSYLHDVLDSQEARSVQSEIASNNGREGHRSRFKSAIDFAGYFDLFCGRINVELGVRVSIGFFISRSMCASVLWRGMCPVASPKGLPKFVQFDLRRHRLLACLG